MNIFVLDKNPVVAAKNNNDQHCTKIVLEISQMLACPFSLERLSQKDVPLTKGGTSRKHSYYNHPVTKWVRESPENFRWAIVHALALDVERRERNGGLSKKPEHFSIPFIDWALNHIDEVQFNKSELTTFAVAISEFNKEKKVYNQSYAIIKKYNLPPITAYKLYYKLDKSFATWKRNRPEWMDHSIEDLIKS
jgi:hypothetical protein